MGLLLIPFFLVILLVFFVITFVQVLFTSVNTRFGVCCGGKGRGGGGRGGGRVGGREEGQGRPSSASVVAGTAAALVRDVSRAGGGGGGGGGRGVHTTTSFTAPLSAFPHRPSSVPTPFSRTQRPPNASLNRQWRADEPKVITSLSSLPLLPPSLYSFPLIHPCCWLLPSGLNCSPLPPSLPRSSSGCRSTRLVVVVPATTSTREAARPATGVTFCTSR